MNKGSFIEFEDFTDLFSKIDKLKNILKEKSEEFKTQLYSRGIQFESISEYGVSIDVGSLSKDDAKFITSHNYNVRDKIKKEIGIKY